MFFTEKRRNPGQRAPWFIVSTDPDGIIVGEIAKFSGRDHHVFKMRDGMVLKALEMQEIGEHMARL